MRLQLLVPVFAMLVPAVAAAEVRVDVDVKVDVAVDAPVHPVVVEPPYVEPVLVEPAPPRRRGLFRGNRWEASLGIEGGRFAIDDIVGGQFGVRGALGRQFGPLRIALEGSLGKFSATRDLYDANGWWNGWEDVGGEVRRVGVTARYRGSFNYQPTAPGAAGFAGAGFIEVGLGRQTIAWNGGGEVERTDYALGAGLEFAGGRRRMGGMELGVRLIASPRMDPADRTHDLGVLATLGAIIGS